MSTVCILLKMLVYIRSCSNYSLEAVPKIALGIRPGIPGMMRRILHGDEARDTGNDVKDTAWR